MTDIEQKHNNAADELAVDIKNIVDETEYLEYVKKFEERRNKPRTTDDTFTPANIYRVVKEWAVGNYGLDGMNIVRPFYPGGDYQKVAYTKNDVVIDNPPFSIMAEIVKFYQKNNIKFVLFYMSNYALNHVSNDLTAILTGSSIFMENGAEIPIAFITNLDPDNIVIVDPSLAKDLKEQDSINRKNHKDTTRKEPRKVMYPENLYNFSKLQQLVNQDEVIKVPKDQAFHIRKVKDEDGKYRGVFGSAIILSDKEHARLEKIKESAANKPPIVAPRQQLYLYDEDLEKLHKLNNK